MGGALALHLGFAMARGCFGLAQLPTSDHIVIMLVVYTPGLLYEHITMPWLAERVWRRHALLGDPPGEARWS